MSSLEGCKWMMRSDVRWGVVVMIKKKWKVSFKQKKETTTKRNSNGNEKQNKQHHNSIPFFKNEKTDNNKNFCEESHQLLFSGMAGGSYLEIITTNDWLTTIVIRQLRTPNCRQLSTIVDNCRQLLAMGITTITKYWRLLFFKFVVGLIVVITPAKPKNPLSNLKLFFFKRWKCTCLTIFSYQK